MKRNNVSDILGQFRDWRGRQKLSQVQLGQRLGVAPVSNHSNRTWRQRHRLSTLLEMARALGLEAVLVPKNLLPALRHLLPRERGGSEFSTTAPPRRLLGNEPDDAEVGCEGSHSPRVWLNQIRVGSIISLPCDQNLFVFAEYIRAGDRPVLSLSFLR
jgi:HTH-type transcriptional regulator / antitoxin HipB